MMMNGLRRGVSAIAPQMRSGLQHNVRMGVVVSRHMVDLATKEQGEEVSYIRRQEHERKARLRAQMEEILAREQHDEEHQALVNVIESKKTKVDSKDVGILQYLGLDDWKWALPVSISLASPMIAHEVIVVDYKFYLVGAFCMMWHAYDMVVLPIYLEKTSWIGEYIANFWKDVDDKAVAEINDAIDSSEGFVDAKDVFKDMFTGIDEVAAAQATALNLTHQNDLHRAIQKKLDALASLNEATNAAIRTDMMQTVKSEAFNVVSTDRKVKDAALSQAIATLAAGPKGKRGKDVVGEVYAKAIADYRAGLSAKDHKVHNITAKLEADIAEIVKAPAVIQTAGNVYETHPVLGA